MPTRPGGTHGPGRGPEDSRPRLRGVRITEDLAALSFDDCAFDCVYADDTLEYAFDVDRTLRELRRVLCDGGVLIAALPSDVRNAGRTCHSHTWTTSPHDVRTRLEVAGFIDVSAEEIDSFRELGMPPYPPSDDTMKYVTAVRRD